MQTPLRVVCVRPAALKNRPMAIYHLSVKTISRSAGRSATAAAAYRTGEKGMPITDLRTGEVHDYTRKKGVAHAELALPANAPEWASDRGALWNAAEQAEKRKNSTVAREFEIGLPAELPAEQRQSLILDFAHELAERHGIAVDVSIHEPGKEGDNRNHHAHVLCSTRRLAADGFGEKSRELDDLKTGPKEVERWRARWAEMGGQALEQAGHQLEADRFKHGHLTLPKQVEAARERDDVEFVAAHEGREPTRHLGPTATAIERRTGQPSRKRLDHDQGVADRLLAAKQAGELEREGEGVEQSILDLSGDLNAARADRDRMQRDLTQRIELGMSSIDDKFAQWEATQRAKEERQRQEQQQREEQERQQRADRLRQLQTEIDLRQGSGPGKSSGPDRGYSR